MPARVVPEMLSALSPPQPEGQGVCKSFIAMLWAVPITKHCFRIADVVPECSSAG